MLRGAAPSAGPAERDPVRVGDRCEILLGDARQPAGLVEQACLKVAELLELRPRAWTEAPALAARQARCAFCNVRPIVRPALAMAKGLERRSIALLTKIGRASCRER